MIAALWRCVLCGEVRGWGSRAPDRDYAPLLHCRHCDGSTRHAFVTIATSQPRPARAVAVR
jgi:hypothetical protein